MADSLAPRLYYVRADSSDGDNMDLFVRANTPAEAERFWSNYYEFEHSERPKWVGAVPDAPARGAINWSSINPE